MARRQYRRFLRRRGGFIPGSGPRRARTVSRSRGLSSRTSDFYARRFSRPKLNVPSLYKAKNVGRRLSTSTQTRPIRSRTTAKSSSVTTRRAEADRKVRVIMDMRRRYKRPPMMGRRDRKMQNIETPMGDGNSMSFFKKKGLRLRGLRRNILARNPMQIAKAEYIQNLYYQYGRQGIVTVLTNTNTSLDAITDTVSTGVTGKFMIMNTTAHYMISNGAKAGCKLRIYEGCYKNDATAANTPPVLWANGMVDAGSTQSVNSIDATPFASPSFNEYMHITKVYNIFIPQGRTHEHYSKYGYNKIYNKETENAGGGIQNLQHWTRFIMFVAYGEPVAGDTTQVTTGSGRLLIVGTTQTRYKYDATNTYRVRYTQSIPNTGIGPERLIDEGSGEIETNVNL